MSRVEFWVTTVCTICNTITLLGILTIFQFWLIPVMESNTKRMENLRIENTKLLEQIRK